MKRILIIFAIFFSISAFSQEEKAVKTDRNVISIEIGGGSVYYLFNSDDDFVKYRSGDNYSVYLGVTGHIGKFAIGSQLLYVTKNVMAYDFAYCPAWKYENYDFHDGIFTINFRYNLSIKENFIVSPSFTFRMESYAPNCDNSGITLGVEFSQRLYNSLYIKLVPYYNYSIPRPEDWYCYPYSTNYGDYLLYWPVTKRTGGYKSFGVSLGLEWYIW